LLRSGDGRVTVLGIDPGRDKCGMAVCAPGAVLARTIVPPADVPRMVVAWAGRYRIDAIVVGGGTGSRAIMAALARLDGSERLPPVTAEEERGSTLAARRRYFEEHPAKGWRRFVPRSFQVPPEPYDDYAAMVIAERRMAKG
jgi:RNase H-fold protein (predicted Holliday junction resolvase)